MILPPHPHSHDYLPEHEFFFNDNRIEAGPWTVIALMKPHSQMRISSRKTCCIGKIGHLKRVKTRNVKLYFIVVPVTCQEDKRLSGRAGVFSCSLYTLLVFLEEHAWWNLLECSCFLVEEQCAYPLYQTRYVWVSFWGKLVCCMF